MTQLEKFRKSMSGDVLLSWASDAQKEIDALRAENEKLRGKAVELSLPDGFAVAAYCNSNGVTIDSVKQSDGSIKWAARNGLNCLGRDGEWEYEPRPSERDEEFLTRYRFDTANEAAECVARSLSQKA